MGFVELVMSQYAGNKERRIEHKDDQIAPDSFPIPRLLHKAIPFIFFGSLNQSTVVGTGSGIIASRWKF
jgi:hypothetical protein